jgi:hypothetical protein
MNGIISFYEKVDAPYEGCGASGLIGLCMIFSYAVKFL